MSNSRNLESYINFNDPPEARALLFPPTEIDRLQNDEYIPFNPDTINTFTYPSNISMRKYQFEISKVCLRYNTLVCLPTGSGKTLIAAVTMMNFLRWFPKGKIIFMAPTRTLVNQQVEACANFTDIKKDKFIIMTGSNANGAMRKNIWKEKSVFFCTPQIVNNDIDKKRLDPTKIVLLIFDEAHHAKNNYAYCVIVRKIAARTSQFRVIGLSATPGGDLISIQAVIYNLMISKIKYLDENDPDIAQYQHERNVEFVTVPLSTDESVLEDYLGQCITVLAEQIQIRGFLNSSNPKTLSRGSVFYQMSNYKKNAVNKSSDFYMILDKFILLLSLTSMMEKLTKYGAKMLNQALKDFVTKKKQTESKKKIEESSAFQTLLRLTERSKNVSHPKLARLGVILEDFLNANPSSRIIVFTQFRAAALTIEEHLKKIPVVKCSIFIGKNNTCQNEGLDESTQLEIMKLFRKGNINCIIATSVGEEGLDIGEVDLIVCYDTTASPLKTVQRMGRTGRKRNGKVIFLMAEGYEEKSLEKAQSTRSYIKTQLNDAEKKFALYNPEVPNIKLPETLTPVIVPCARLQTGAEGNGRSDDDDGDEIQGLNDNRKKDEKNKSALLSRKQKFALERCFGVKLKYLPVRKEKWSSASGSLFSHSAESGILDDIFSMADGIEELMKRFGSDNGASSSSSDEDGAKEKIEKAAPKENSEKKGVFDISDDSDDEVVVLKSGYNSALKKSEDPFRIDDDELSLPCIPLGNIDEDDDDDEDNDDVAHRMTAVPKKKASFLTDDDDDDVDFDEQEFLLKKPQQPPKTFLTGKQQQKSFLSKGAFRDSDDDDDDVEMIKLADEAESKFGKQNHFLSSDSDSFSEGDVPEEIKGAKAELGKKSPMKFLDDSDVDIDC